MILVSIVLGVVAGLISAAGLGCVVGGLVRYIKRGGLIVKGAVVFSPKIPGNSIKSVALEERLGGRYYRAVVEDGLSVAVKRVEETRRRSMTLRLQALAALSHRNLMSLRAYVWSESSLLLVYDYLPCGSLADAMEKHLHLSWLHRLRIALGIVRALHYLHHTARILHRNLKPSNVLLHPDFEPSLVDAHYSPNPDPTYTDKSDVFSFGLILALLLTGKELEESNIGCLQRLQEAGDARQALDDSILGEEIEEDEMLMALKIALLCLSPHPPSTYDLLSMLTQLNSF